jgi:hypothetical protein
MKTNADTRTYIIRDIHPIDGFFLDRDRYIGKQITPIDIETWGIQIRKIAGWQYGSGIVDGREIVFHAFHIEAID